MHPLQQYFFTISRNCQRPQRKSANLHYKKGAPRAPFLMIKSAKAE